MKHLSNNEFTELMSNKGKTAVVTKDGIYHFIGIGEYMVAIRFSFKLKEEYQIGETGFYVNFNNIITMTEAQCMYMSLE